MNRNLGKQHSLSNVLIIAGIGTDVGKTVASAIVTESLESDYWKPVQAGNLDCTDSDVVRSLISNPHTKIHPEAYRLTQPISPHAAAPLDDIKIILENIILPGTNRHIVVELAGGIMSPLNATQHNIHLMKKLDAPVILVSKNYLGSINHTLLTVEVCKVSGLHIAGIIFDGIKTPSSEDYILQYCDVPVIGRINLEEQITPTIVRRYAELMRDHLHNIIDSPGNTLLDAR